MHEGCNNWLDELFLYQVLEPWWDFSGFGSDPSITLPDKFATPFSILILKGLNLHNPPPNIFFRGGGIQKIVRKKNSLFQCFLIFERRYEHFSRFKLSSDEGWICPYLDRHWLQTAHSRGTTVCKRVGLKAKGWLIHYIFFFFFYQSLGRSPPPVRSRNSLNLYNIFGLGDVFQ